MSDALSPIIDSNFSSAGNHVRVSGIIEESIVDGPGLRFVLFTQGCVHDCKGCHNPDTHGLEGGELMSAPEILRIYRESGASGITISGGEPFLQGEGLSWIGREVHKLGGDVITYTGYEYENLIELKTKNSSVRMLLQVTDLIIDGPFILEERTMERPFVGSANQKLIPLSERGKALLQLIK